MQQPYPPQYYPPQMRKRPLGVTILAILEVIGGLFLLIAALGSLLIAAMITNPMVYEALQDSGAPQWLIDNAAVIFGVIGLFSLVMAVISFLLAYGFLNGRKWSWTLGVALSIVSIVWTFASPALLGFSVADIPSIVINLVISGVIIYYLFQPGVKAWFGKA